MNTDPNVVGIKLMEGLYYKHNPKFDIDVITLHYSADPSKNPNTPQGKEWVKSAKKGLSERRWRKEYEIDFYSLQGDKVYNFPKKNIVDPLPMKELLNGNWCVYTGHDYGRRAPTAHIWVAVNRDGKRFVFHEIYERWRSIEYFKKKIYIFEQPFRHLVVGRYGDPRGDTVAITDNKSIIDHYASGKMGIIILPGNNRLLDGIEKLSAKFENGDYFISKTCVNLLSELDKYSYKKEGRGSKVESEIPIDNHNHALDALRYVEMANPVFVDLNRINYRYEEEALNSDIRNQTYNPIRDLFDDAIALNEEEDGDDFEEYYRKLRLRKIIYGEDDADG